MNDKNLATIDDLEITPLSDEELDSVAGGYTDTNSTAPSCSCCASGATNQDVIIAA